MLNDTRKSTIRSLIWVYFWLVIFEGALRKWIVPSLSTPLLLIRDPFAVTAILLGWPLLIRSRWKPYFESLLIIGIFAFVAALVFGHGDIITATFGARILLLHLPLVFLFPLVFSYRTFKNFCLSISVLTIFMTILIVLQYTLPQSHFLNVAPGGDISAGFTGALNKFRPPGTFSFTNGTTLFYTLAASVFMVSMTCFKTSGRTKLLIYFAGLSLIIAIPVSISRSLLFGVLIVVAGTIVAFLLSRTKIGPLVLSLLVIGSLLLGASFIPIFKEAMVPFLARWDTATEIEGGARGVVGVLDKRVVSIFTDGAASVADLSISGYGIGLGTNVGASRVGRSGEFILSEDAWLSTLLELGIVLGPLFLFFRIFLSIDILISSVAKALAKNKAPLIFASSSIPILLIGNFGQPTALGFAVITIGLFLASCTSASDRFHNRYYMLPTSLTSA